MNEPYPPPQPYSEQPSQQLSQQPCHQPAQASSTGASQMGGAEPWEEPGLLPYGLMQMQGEMPGSGAGGAPGAFRSQSPQPPASPPNAPSQSSSQSPAQSQSQSQSQSRGGGSQSQRQGAITRPPPLPGEPDEGPDDASLRWLRVLHETRYYYGSPVELAHHVAHLTPRNTPNQKVRGWAMVIDPPPDEWAAMAPEGGVRVEPSSKGELPSQFSLDSWGNPRLAFSHARVHDSLLVSSSFEVGIAPVELGDTACGVPWEAVAESLRYHAGAVHSEAVEFTLSSYFAPRAPQLAEFGREAFTPGRPLMAGAMALMKLVHERFEYKPNSTSVATRALEALALSKGVCQDFAHVMIGACRSLGLAARYVSGYLLTQPPPGQPRLVGADASHAWVEIWCPERGWVALDPTNDVPAGIDHVTLAWGRDYADVAPLRGVIRGGGRSQPDVAVTVQPLDEV